MSEKEPSALDLYEQQVAASGGSGLNAALDARRVERALDGLTVMMENRNGRRFVYWLLDKAGIARTSFTGRWGSTSFNEGRRSLGTEVFAMVEANCPDLYLTMMKEARQDEENDRANLERNE